MINDVLFRQMKKQRIYLDTSVIGGCFDDEFKVWSLGLFRDLKEGLFRPVISEIVEEEIKGAPLHVVEKYDELLSYGTEILYFTDEVQNLAKNYVERKILGVKYLYDGYHIAFGTVYNVNLLVSWNFKHIVHYDKIRMFNGINMELGYNSIQIYSPMEVTSYGKEKEV